MYQRNPLLQQYLPRGVVLIHRDNQWNLCLFSNRKFYGRRAGDDDDCDLTSSTLLKGQYTSFLVSEKANGESAQLVSYTSFIPLNDFILLITIIIYYFVHSNQQRTKNIILYFDYEDNDDDDLLIICFKFVNSYLITTNH